MSPYTVSNGIIAESLHARQSAWRLEKSYEGNSFFDGFDFFSRKDPSNGAVTYVDRETALGSGLAFWTKDGIPGIQAEHWQTLPVGTPRNSVRINSKALYGGGLFVVDLALLPWGCGVWPAVWLLGYEQPWPYAGEIDIVEGVQEAKENRMTVHTGPGCSITQDGSFSGSVMSTNCDATIGGSGCSVTSDWDVSYGRDFNERGGGVFATLWDGDGIKMWNWGRGNVPNDLSSNNPQPRNWGKPVAAFNHDNCDPYKFFQPATIILNVNLCGDWAGNTYPSYSYCPGTCLERIADPSNLVNTVMLINSIKVYQQTGTNIFAGEVFTNTNMTGVGGSVGRQVDRAGAGRSIRSVRFASMLPILLLAVSRILG